MKARSKLLPDKPAVHETAILERGRPLMLELYPTHMLLRLKRQREAVHLDYEVALACARKVAAREKGIKI